MEIVCDLPKYQYRSTKLHGVKTQKTKVGKKCSVFRNVSLRIRIASERYAGGSVATGLPSWGLGVRLSVPPRIKP
jgi:hypothetical protein